MKKTLLYAAMLLTGIALHAQVVEVAGINKITLPAGVEVDQPTISPDGSFVVSAALSTPGLQRISLDNATVSKITDNGSPLDVAISADGANVLYRCNTTAANKLRYTSLRCADLKAKTDVQIVEPSRNLGGFAFNKVGDITAISNDKQILRRAKATGASQAATPVVSINRGHLSLTVNGQTTILDPCGKGSYLWPSISPDGKKIAFFLSYRGAMVCDIDGSNVVALGNYQQPRWIDNNSLVSMKTFDDGKYITEGQIVALDLKGNAQVLTPNNVIALYPSASADGKKIAFSTAQGELYIINLK